MYLGFYVYYEWFSDFKHHWSNLQHLLPGHFIYCRQKGRKYVGPVSKLGSSIHYRLTHPLL